MAKASAWLSATPDTDDLEQLCRYGARAPISNDRLSVDQRGQVHLRLSKRDYDDRTELVMPPVALLRKSRRCMGCWPQLVVAAGVAPCQNRCMNGSRIAATFSLLLAVACDVPSEEFDASFVADAASLSALAGTTACTSGAYWYRELKQYDNIGIRGPGDRTQWDGWRDFSGKARALDPTKPCAVRQEVVNGNFVVTVSAVDDSASQRKIVVTLPPAACSLDAGGGYTCATEERGPPRQFVRRKKSALEIRQTFVRTNSKRYFDILYVDF